MKNQFIAEIKQAMARLALAQAKRKRLVGRAQRRHGVALARYEQDTREAEQIEADAWKELLAIPGMSVGAAAAILQVSESSVARWASRVDKATSRGGSR